MSRRFREQNFERKVYVGELGNGASKQALEDAFSYYGYLRNVWVARNPPGFAFVEFEDPRDAEDACRGLDGRLMNGKRMRVEMCKGHMKRNSRPPPRGRPFHPDDRCYECGERGHYARDCTRGKNSGHKKRSYSRSRSRSPARNNYSRSRSHSRSKSPMKKGRPASRSPGYGASAARSRSGSPLQNNYSRSRSRSRSRTPMKKARPVSKSSSRSRSRSPRNGDYLPYRE